MGAAFAAIGGALAALFEATVASRLHIADAQLQIVLVLAIVATIAFSFEAGMAVAFVGGLFADLLFVRPLGATPVCMLLAVAGTAAVAHYLQISKLLVSVLSVFVWTMGYLILSNWMIGLLRPPTYPLHLTSLFWTALINAVLAGLALVIAAWIRGRWEGRRKAVDW